MDSFRHPPNMEVTFEAQITMLEAVDGAGVGVGVGVGEAVGAGAPPFCVRMTPSFFKAPGDEKR